MISPQYVSVPPSREIRMNCGISVSWYGTISMEMNVQNSMFRPKNRFFANAYAAKEAKVSTRMTDTPA